MRFVNLALVLLAPTFFSFSPFSLLHSPNTCTWPASRPAEKLSTTARQQTQPKLAMTARTDETVLMKEPLRSFVLDTNDEARSDAEVFDAANSWIELGSVLTEWFCK
jgi:hypothetical protein